MGNAANNIPTTKKPLEDFLQAILTLRPRVNAARRYKRKMSHKYFTRPVLPHDLSSGLRIVDLVRILPLNPLKFVGALEKAENQKLVTIHEGVCQALGARAKEIVAEGLSAGHQLDSSGMHALWSENLSCTFPVERAAAKRNRKTLLIAAAPIDITPRGEAVLIPEIAVFLANPRREYRQRRRHRDTELALVS